MNALETMRLGNVEKLLNLAFRNFKKLLKFGITGKTMSRQPITILLADVQHDSQRCLYDLNDQSPIHFNIP